MKFIKNLRAIASRCVSACFPHERCEWLEIPSSDANSIIKLQLIEGVIGLFVLIVPHYYYMAFLYYDTVLYDIVVVNGGLLGGLLMLVSVIILLWLIFWILGSVIICLMVLKKQAMLAELRIGKSMMKWPIFHRLVFSGGKGWIALYTTVYSPKGKRNGVICLVVCLLAMSV